MRESKDLAVLLMGIFNPELRVSRSFFVTEEITEKHYARSERNNVVLSYNSGITQGEARNSRTALTDRRINFKK